jgi:hypothetical protein
MKIIRGVLVKIAILLLIVATTSCAVTSKHKYRKRRKMRPCDCPQFSKNSDENNYTATALFCYKTD